MEENLETLKKIYDLGKSVSKMGEEQESVQLMLLGHSIITACKAVSQKEGCILLQRHLNEFVDSIRMENGNLKAMDYLCKEKEICQN